MGEAAGVGGNRAQGALVGVSDRRDDERVGRGDGDPDVDAGVQFELPVAVGAVRARVRAQRERCRFDDEVIDRGDRLVVVGNGSELGAQFQERVHPRVGLDLEVRDRGFGLRHPPGDELLGARQRHRLGLRGRGRGRARGGGGHGVGNVGVRGDVGAGDPSAGAGSV